MYAVPSIHTVIIVCKYENLLWCVEASQKYVMCLTLCKVHCLLASIPAANVRNMCFVVLPA